MPIARSALLILLVTCVAAAAADEPRFPVESIRVSGLRFASPAIVVAESQLNAGSSYTEGQIRDAVARVRRLPFVLDTDVQLEKGSVRGTYVVVLRVTENKPLFGNWRTSIDMFATTRQVIDPSTGRSETVSGRVLRDHVDRETIGGRIFPGSRTMLAVTADIGGTDPLGAGDNRYSIAFTQYDLFATRASIAALVQYREFRQDFTEVPDLGGATTTSFGDHLIWNVSAAFPLRENQALRATWHREQRTRDVNPEGTDFLVRRSVHTADLSWIYDTTDDLLLPSSGVYATISARAYRDSRFTSADPDDPRNLNAEYFWSRDLVAGLTKYWEITPHQSVIGGLDVTRGSSGVGQIAGRAGYTASLWSGHAPGSGELRFHLEAEPAYSDSGGLRASARAGLVFRNVWGVARFDLSYNGWRLGNE